MSRQPTVETPRSGVEYETPDLFRTSRYPIHQPESSAYADLVRESRRRLANERCCQLAGFIRPAMVRLMQSEANNLVSSATFTQAELNPYFSIPADDIPADHPLRRFSLRRHGMVRADRFHRNGVIWTLFQNQDLCDFVAQTLGYESLYTYRDPYSSVNINVQPAGCEFAWHFDNNDFTVSLGLKQCRKGGQFEYVADLRSETDENYRGVQAVLDGERGKVRTLVLEPGDLQLFIGGNSLHRVTAPLGEERQSLLLSYVTDPANLTSPQKAKRIWSEAHPLHYAYAQSGESSSMKSIGFIGLGTMGFPMAGNLKKAGFDVVGFDIDEGACERFQADGGKVAGSSADAVTGAEVIVTMLLEGEHVRAVYDEQFLSAAPANCLLIDCSTIDVATAREVSSAAAERGLEMLDAPVSGGDTGAAAGTLAFMVGGTESAFERALPVLEGMGKRILLFGPSGSGQSAKACHNMICGITSLAVCEGFGLAERLGLDPKQFYDLCSGAAAQSWMIENRCPVPGVAPHTPASNDYLPGFASRLMAKDLRLAQAAAKACRFDTPFGAEAARRFTAFTAAGNGDLDFSAIYRLVLGE